MSSHDEKYFRDNYDLNDKDYYIRLKNYIINQYRLNNETVGMIKNYLTDRFNNIVNKNVFGIVYDITYYCNLNCSHCAVNAKCIRSTEGQIKYEINFDNVVIILNKIYEYIKNRGVEQYFLMFGGGEPFIREDIKDILKYANSLFGSQNIGLNTNGTLVDIDDINDIKHYLGVIEISLDGFREYHNKWRKVSKESPIKDPFNKTLELIKKSVKVDSLRPKIEISSVITNENLKNFLDFVEFLIESGVERYSVHRPMPIGRMENHLDKIPNTKEFLLLLLDIAKLKEKYKNKIKDLHIHHSLESIFSVMFLGYDIHLSNNLLSSKRHSIGIDPYGNVHFDPWCVIPPYNKLSAGNLLESNQTLEKMIHSRASTISIADEITKKSFRCSQCKLPCSGGMRLNALANYISKVRKPGVKSITESHLLVGLSKIDPACPLYSYE